MKISIADNKMKLISP